MSNIAYRSLIAEGDQWLELARDTFSGGGDYNIAAAAAAIATAYYGRANIEKPEPIADLLTAAAQSRAATPAADTDLEQAVRRHPAGNRRVTVNDPIAPEGTTP
ncbi:hypothetical protein SEA_EVANESCE_60 [Mycobacterium phage Evanesce]|uniref:Uncharacterized protein n=14 Tax=Caudoviricetes TaxID=2731619 RepID=A0A385D124_9CAUD|nr:hypothetical protein Giles_58 [Mycobacterium phage Giles]AHY84245.1 hypothetical protein PBI_HH92_60 [Mycobacterium phage HH92]AKQ07836.1 hypothetical protein SEA_KINBOTE_60 [Mycobacterium phage Kinbote]ALF00281.1 hypothetical protein SEA_EVANESCE_60 [Mycobacterium phage Evanesce]ATN90434.1 hypothetical protein SEA_LILHAZELNUT_61 [Mycobacterium phage LilHazelnut]AXQ51491.1 hypothetical protein SEA_AMOCHICK_61 [Mycobacterium phage Amochick]QBQ71260.1 hypothetical protein SEA_DAEGAL_63 [Myco